MKESGTNIVEKHIPCPVCPSSDAYCTYDDGHGYCYSCNYYKPSNKEIDLNEYTYEYKPLRGLSKETLRHYGILTAIDSDGKPIKLGLPYSNGSTKVRSLTDKKFWWEGEHKHGLFGLDKFAAGSHKYVAITEGELDAASLYQALAGRVPVVSVQSASSAAADVAADRVFLGSFERIYLAFDGDVAGRTATTAVARLFDFNKVYHVRFSRMDRKDSNDFVAAGEAEELANIFWNAKKYLPETVTSTQEDFRRILSEPSKPSVPYPFQSLNKMTYGIRTGETVLITAPEGVGKTELMHTIEYKLLRETKDAVAAFYLEEPQKRHLQALAGIALKSPVHLPDSGYTGDQVLAALQELVQGDDRLYLYSNFGSDDPDVLLDTVRYLVTACNVRYVLFDHITMAISGLSGEDERRALDYLSTRLEMMVKELDFALIIVSHVNDFGQTRGSRYISKVADIRIDISRDLLSDNPFARNTTKIIISKNRYSGLTGPAGEYTFDPTTHLLGQPLEFADVKTISNDNEPAAATQEAA